MKPSPSAPGKQASAMPPPTPAPLPPRFWRTWPRYQGVKAEWASNEKVALDAALGAACAGVRALAAMKHVGVNVAADTLFSSAYTGVRGGLVLVSADDPGCWSSQNEQDNRQYARFAKLPCIEPSDSQEAKDFVAAGLRAERAVRHAGHAALDHTPVPFQDGGGGRRTRGARRQRSRATFVPNPSTTWSCRPMPAACIPWSRSACSASPSIGETSPLNRIEWGDRRLGIVTSSIAYQYAREIFDGASFLKLGLSYPLPPRLIRDFAAQVERLIVVEELDPFFEEQIRAMGIAVSGKEYLPASRGELNLAIVRGRRPQARASRASCRRPHEPTSAPALDDSRPPAGPLPGLPAPLHLLRPEQAEG